MLCGSYARIPAGPLWLAAAAALLAIAFGLLPGRSTAQSRRSSAAWRDSDRAGAASNERRAPRSQPPRTANSRQLPADSRRVAQLEALDAARNLRSQIESLGAADQPAEAPQEPARSEVIEQLPDDGGPYEVPLVGSGPDEIILEENDGLISLFVRNGSLQDVLTALAETQGLNIVTADGLDAPLTITLDRIRQRMR